MIWTLEKTSDLTEEQFLQWQKLLEDRSGIRIANTQAALLKAQLSTRIRELGLVGYEEYYQQVTQGVLGRIEWSIFIDRLTVKETLFYRHKDSLVCVRQYVKDFAQRYSSGRSVEAWSLGCSTGEEAYSLAIAINDGFRLAETTANYAVTATDISQSALRHARKGIYNRRKMHELTQQQLDNYFEATGNNELKVIDPIRDRMCFTQGNLLQIDAMPVKNMDVIFCQNVLIYFRRWMRRQILNGLVERLNVGGLLVVGLGEVVDWKHPKLKKISSDRIQAYVRHS